MIPDFLRNIFGPSDAEIAAQRKADNKKRAADHRVRTIFHGACINCESQGDLVLCDKCFVKTRNSDHKDLCSNHTDEDLYWDANGNCFPLHLANQKFKDTSRVIEVDFSNGRTSSGIRASE